MRYEVTLSNRKTFKSLYSVRQYYWTTTYSDTGPILNWQEFIEGEYCLIHDIHLNCIDENGVDIPAALTMQNYPVLQGEIERYIHDGREASITSIFNDEQLAWAQEQVRFLKVLELLE